MSEQAPLPPPIPDPYPWLARLRGLRAWGLVISLAINVMIGGLLGFYAPAKADAPETERVSFTHKIKVVLPTPSPTPKVEPTKLVRSTPAPAAKLKVHVVKSESKSDAASSEHAYVPPAAGSEQGAPAGEATSGAGAAAAPTPAPTPEPTPSPTPKPVCANPKAPAAMIKKAEVDYPEAARAVDATGEVQVKVTLAASGSVLTTAVVKSAGNRALDQAGLKAAQQSTYSPEMVDCAPVGGSYLFVAEFN